MMTRSELETDARDGLYRVTGEDTSRQNTQTYSIQRDALECVHLVLFARICDASHALPGAEVVQRPDGKLVIYQWGAL